MRPATLTALLVLSGFCPCLGQTPPEGRPDSTCTYATCALRFRGNAIIAGAEGYRVGGFGFFRAPALRPWIELSDSASSYLRIAEANYTSGQVLGLAGLAMVTAGLLRESSWDGDGWDAGATGLILGGYAALVIGGRKVSRSRDAVHSSIWWYNAALADLSIVPDQGSRPAAVDVGQAVSKHRGRNGLIIGSLAGLGVGLAVSSRHPASETAQGILETLGVGALGAVVGWRIGVRRHVGRAKEIPSRTTVRDEERQ